MIPVHLANFRHGSTDYIARFRARLDGPELVQVIEAKTLESVTYTPALIGAAMDAALAAYADLA